MAASAAVSLPNSAKRRHAELLDEGVDDTGIIDASVVRAMDGAELVDAAVLAGEEEAADRFDAADETQIVVEPVCDHWSRYVRLVEIAGL